MENKANKMETDNSNKATFGTTTTDAMSYEYPEYWSCTNELRWLKRTIEMDINLEVVRTISILQQKWQGSKGTIEWKDVPTVT